MINEEDLFGEILYAHYKDEDSAHVIERDDGHVSVYGSASFYFSEFKDWSDLEKEAMQYVGGEILDVGCGAGRHSLYFQKNKLNVLAIDNSPGAIKVCKLRGIKNAKLLSLHDIQPNLGMFDTIIMMGNNFGLFGNPTNAKKLLKTFYKITSDEGTIVAPSVNTYSTKNKDHLDYIELNRSRGRIGGQVLIRTRFKKLISSWMDLLLVSQEEMEEILKGTGWKLKHSLQEQEGSGSYIAILRKEN
ncbi:MAG: class I SAM-dependent methyltransferase [Candidatus Heimdallarchaeaceae archaeon]